VLIDLRSDTVTKPTPAMRRAMAEAEVGDDVYGEDPTVNRLEALAAATLGFEAALFLPSGTMGNAVAVRLLTEPGQEVLAEERAHVVNYEMSGLATLSGVMPRTVRTPDGLLTAEAIRAAIRPKSGYTAELGLVVLENTQNLAGGIVQDVDSMRAAIAEARTHGLRVHLDGARVWNAAVALGVPPKALASGADTVMVSLAKGLGAPVGALLAASAALVAKGRRVRKQLGGGMRQAGILAAAGIVAIETMVERLAEDHANARLLGEALRRVEGATVKPVETNIVIAVLEGRSAPEAVSALRERGLLGLAMDARTLRLTTHKDVSRADCARAAALLEGALSPRVGTKGRSGFGTRTTRTRATSLVEKPRRTASRKG
jgi:threonine aldolase